MAAAAAAATLLSESHALLARAAPNPSAATRPPIYKAVGISLAICSGLFIGTSFIFKKVGLLKANVKYNEEAGEGMGYLKNAFWWTGMTLMIVGEVCNFVAYAFVDAILVTPFGALSVVVTAVLSAIFLKERLSFVGKVGCFQCVIGSIVIVLNAPQQSSVATIQEMKHFVIAPGFLSYAGVVIVASIFIALWAGPRYGKSSMMVYLSVCSLIGGLSVVATQGLGAAIVAQISGTPQFNQWFLYVLLVFVVATLVTEIIYLNKALNIFNAALVTPTYYVFFTSSTIVAGAVLFQGFKGTPTSITTVVMGFFVICSGVVLLQLSKSAKDVPDTAVFTGDLDQVRTVAEQEQPESEPKADAIRGTAAIIRRLSQATRGKWEAEEAKRVHEAQMKDRMNPITENEQYEWDGLRRRRTTTLDSAGSALHRRKTLHPPLGLTHFPDPEDDYRPESGVSGTAGGFLGSFSNSFRRRAPSTLVPRVKSPGPPMGLQPIPSNVDGEITEIAVPAYKGPDLDQDTVYGGQHPDGSMEMMHVYGLPAGLRPEPPSPGPLPPPPRDLRSQPSTEFGSPTGHRGDVRWASDLPSPSHAGLAVPSELHGESSTATRKRPSAAPPARRQFSFQNPFHRHRTPSLSNAGASTGPTGPHLGSSAAPAPPPHHARTQSRTSSKRLGLGSRAGSKDVHGLGGAGGGGSATSVGTEEERLGLVKGDSRVRLPLDGADDEDSSSSDEEEEAGWREAQEKGIEGGYEEVRGNESGREREGGFERYRDLETPRPEARRFQLRDGGEGGEGDLGGMREGSGRGGGGGAFI